jgi:hypothetical protein
MLVEMEMHLDEIIPIMLVLKHEIEIQKLQIKLERLYLHKRLLMLHDL